MGEEREVPEQMAELYERVITGFRTEILEALKTKRQKEVADLCGVTQATIQRIARGRRGQNLPFKTILCIAIGLNIDLGHLISPRTDVDKEKIRHLISELFKAIPAA